VSGMELGDSLHVRDLRVPAGTEFHTDDSLTVATVLVPRGLKEDEEQPEGEEGEEGAEAEAEGGDAKDEKSEGGDS
jgi:large subunit ribosomal protein L25